MFCTKCGSELNEGSSFCTSCGQETLQRDRTSNIQQKTTSLNKFIWPASILLAAIVLGGFFYVTQVSRQNSIERQKTAELQAEKEKEQSEKSARQNCFQSASQAATALLVTKSKLPGGDRFKDMTGQGLYLKDDFDKYYEDCLSTNGLKK